MLGKGSASRSTLPLGVWGKAFEHHKRCRNHGRGQLFLEKTAQFPDRRPELLSRDDVCNKTWIPWDILTGDDRRLPYGGVLP